MLTSVCVCARGCIAWVLISSCFLGELRDVARVYRVSMCSDCLSVKFFELGKVRTSIWVVRALLPALLQSLTSSSSPPCGLFRFYV